MVSLLFSCLSWWSRCRQPWLLFPCMLWHSRRYRSAHFWCCQASSHLPRLGSCSAGWLSNCVTKTPAENFSVVEATCFDHQIMAVWLCDRWNTASHRSLPDIPSADVENFWCLMFYWERTEGQCEIWPLLHCCKVFSFSPGRSMTCLCG